MNIKFEDNTADMPYGEDSDNKLLLTIEFKVETNNFGKFRFKTQIYFHPKKHEISIEELTCNGLEKKEFSYENFCRVTKLTEPKEDSNYGLETWQFAGYESNKELLESRLKSVGEWWKENNKTILIEILKNRVIFNKIITTALEKHIIQ